MPNILTSSKYRSTLNSGCFFSRFIPALPYAKKKYVPLPNVHRRINAK